jgi:hypothetical protein
MARRVSSRHQINFGSNWTPSGHTATAGILDESLRLSANARPDRCGAVLCDQLEQVLERKIGPSACLSASAGNKSPSKLEVVVETSISFMRLLLYASGWPADVTKNPPMREPRNRVVQVRRFGGPDGLEVVDAPLPTAGPDEPTSHVSKGQRNLARFCPASGELPLFGGPRLLPLGISDASVEAHAMPSR